MNTEVRIHNIPAHESTPAILGNIAESIEGHEFQVFILSRPIEENTDCVYLRIGDVSRYQAEASGLMSLHSSKSEISELNSSVISEKDGAADCNSSQMIQNIEISSFDRQCLVSENEAESSGEPESSEKVSKNESFRTESVLTKSEVINCSVERPNIDEILTLGNLMKHYKAKFKLRSQIYCKRYRLKQRAVRYFKLLLGIFLGYYLPILYNIASQPHSILEICSIYNDKFYYEGDCIQEIPSGRGTVIYSDGTTYIGDFIDGLKTGQGFIRFASGATYRGELCNDVISGKGIYEQNGNRYEGTFVDLKLEGTGNYLLSTGESYTGELKNSLKHGKGTLKSPTGDIYEGSFLNDVKHGYGIMKYASGEVYEGNWEQNRRNGKGKMTWKDGRYWDGKWKNDERSFWGEWGKIN